MVSKETVEGVELGVAEESGNALVGEGGGGEEFVDGAETVVAKEIVVIHVGKDMDGGAKIARIYLEGFGYGQDALELTMKQVIANNGGNEAAIVDGKRDLIDGFHGKKVMFFVNDKAVGYWHIEFIECVLSERIIHSRIIYKGE